MKKGEKFKRVTISEKEYEQLCKAEKKEKKTKILKRIYAFKLLYEKWKYTKIAKFLNITNDTITDWIEIYKKEKIIGLLKLNYKGRIPKLNEKQINQIKNKIFLNSKEAKKYILKEYGEDYNSNYVQELLKKKFNYPLKRQN